MHTQLSESNPLGKAAGGAFPKLNKARAIARQCGVHPRTIFRLADAGRLHRYKINARLVLFEEAEVVALLNSARV